MIRNLKRPVRRIERDLEEERPARMLLDEAHPAVGKEIGAVAGRVRRLIRLETRLLVAPSMSRWIARCRRNRVSSASSTMRVIVKAWLTMVSADCARKSLSVHR